VAEEGRRGAGRRCRGFDALSGGCETVPRLKVTAAGYTMDGPRVEGGKERRQEGAQP
jgi:hypothetical protein